jgi:recombination protein RecA
MSQLEEIVKEINKKYNEDIATRGVVRSVVSCIPFTSPRATYMLYGGLPRGRLIEFAGDEGSGKTTTALDVAANAQQLFIDEYHSEIDTLEQSEKSEKLSKTQQTRLNYLQNRGPQKVIYADCENTLDEDWAELLGVDVSDMYILKPQSQSAEEIFEWILRMIDTDEAGLVVIDSLGVMLSQQAYDKTMEERTYGGISMALTLFSKKAVLSCQRTGCTIIGINQVRADMNSTYGGIVTTGGKAWKHNCSVRLMFQKGAFLDERGDELKRSAASPQGNQVLISVAKTKTCKPDRRTGFYTLMYDTGINDIADTVDLALCLGVVQQAGSWFAATRPETGELLYKVQGRPSLIEYLENNPELLLSTQELINNAQ